MSYLYSSDDFTVYIPRADKIVMMKIMRINGFKIPDYNFDKADWEAKEEFFIDCLTEICKQHDYIRVHDFHWGEGSEDTLELENNCSPLCCLEFPYLSSFSEEKKKEIQQDFSSSLEAVEFSDTFHTLWEHEDGRDLLYIAFEELECIKSNLYNFILSYNSLHAEMEALKCPEPQLLSS